MAQSAGYRAPRFLTFKQALELGGNVRKGEHGTKVHFVKQLQVRDKSADDESTTRLIPMMREYTVFNVDQCESLPARVMTLGNAKPRNADERDATIDDFLACSGANIREGFGEAYYRPGDDSISLPRFATFKSAAHYYGTAFHELGHWTGHKSRRSKCSMPIACSPSPSAHAAAGRPSASPPHAAIAACPVPARKCRRVRWSPARPRSIRRITGRYASTTPAPAACPGAA